MNESDFENDLRKLRPSPPPVTLEQAIARELATPVSSPVMHGHASSGVIVRTKESTLRRLLSGLGWACAGATAAVVATASMHPTPLPQALPQATNQLEATNVFEPAESSRELLATEETEVLYTEDEEPARMVRYNSVERYVWANPATGAQVEVEVPREDFVLLPVSFQ